MRKILVNEHVLTKAYEDLAHVKMMVTGCKETSDPQWPAIICPWSLYTTGDRGNEVQKQPKTKKNKVQKQSRMLPVGC